jgi:hypothetical protein
MPGRGDAVVLGIRSLPVAVLFVYQRRLSAALAYASRNRLPGTVCNIHLHEADIKMSQNPGKVVVRPPRTRSPDL